MRQRERPRAQEIAQRFDHVLVDEFQDTNSVQYRLVRLLSRQTGSITVVGDEDQSIYRWRGADIRNILDFERDHPGAFVVKLEQNYRSTGNILRAANAIIEKNSERRPKRLFTESGDGDPLIVFEGRDRARRGRVRRLAHRGGAVDHPGARATSPSSTGPTPSRACWKTRSGRATCRIRWWAARASSTAPRSRTSSATCAPSPTPTTGWRCSGSSTCRHAGSVRRTTERIGDLIYERKISAWQTLELVSTDEQLLGAGPRKKVAAFVELMRKLREEGAGLGPASLAEKVLEESGYRDALAGEATLEAEGRIENLLELVAQMREYEREAEEPTLHGFLERVALASDVDGYDAEKGAVSLMTVHTAKGLEFPVVFLTGLEERIFPHARSVDDDSAVEEERRLCYVAVTRARTLLHLSRVRRRRLSGQELPGIPSRFLRDLPLEGVEQIITARPSEYGGYGSSEGRGPWGGRWSRDEAPASSPYDQRSEFAHLPPGRSRPPAPGPSIARASAGRSTTPDRSRARS